MAEACFSSRVFRALCGRPARLTAEAFNGLLSDGEVQRVALAKQKRKKAVSEGKLCRGTASNSAVLSADCLPGTRGNERGGIERQSVSSRGD